MPITYTDPENKLGDVTTTGCSFCGLPVPDGKGWAEHWKADCPENEANDSTYEDFED